MNLYYKNIYLKEKDSDELSFYNSLLEYFHFSPSEYFVSRLSASQVRINSIFDKNIELKIYFSEDVVIFHSKYQAFGDSEEQLFHQREKYYDYLNAIHPFFDNKNAISISKKSNFSSNILKTEKHLSFIKNFKPEDHRYNRTKEEVLFDSIAEFFMEKTIPANGDKIIANFILNHTIKKDFGFTPSNKVMGFISDNFPELLFLAKNPNNRNLESIEDYGLFKDLLIFDENKELTKESKELFFLNFKF